ncbi:hypothetical protein RHSIM_Rhsim11G0182800 [Rhododendron simsii]|uniref:Choline/ethanolaminephosphotransferase 1 n=1 Tax=Rhododendron simsii TaxID=118357 RepID=A0A834G5Y6_RHOSS|nr:hypothetical protein RHSIM_Rhsim11G0182800 [Rhododendron simsii]
MGYIGSHGVAALHRYKYSGVDHSYVAKYVLQPFWSRFVNFFPLWMPLCKLFFYFWSDYTYRVHVLGYVCTTWLYIFTSPGFSSAKMGTFYAWITSLLISGRSSYIAIPKHEHVTFDAVDGKQARRTFSSSPLGELFDHGCDALACAFESMAFGSTAMCGRSTFWFWVISAVPFYGATWEHYFTNTLILPAVNGPTEGLMLIYLCHFFTAIVGAEWWAQHFGKSFPFLSWVPFFNEIPTYGAVLFLMISSAVIPTISFKLLLQNEFEFLNSLSQVLAYVIDEFPLHGVMLYCSVYNVYKVVQGRKGSMLLALAMLYPFVVLLGGVLLWDYLSPNDLMGTYPHLVILGTGLAFGFLVGRMILAHLCDEPKGLKTNMCMSLMFLPLGIANALTARLNDGIPLVDEQWVLLAYCIYTVTLYLHFATSVIHEITTALGICCFRITRKEA